MAGTHCVTVKPAHLSCCKASWRLAKFLFSVARSAFRRSMSKLSTTDAGPHCERVLATTRQQRHGTACDDLLLAMRWLGHAVSKPGAPLYPQCYS
jgi:hypothetical protein